MGNSNSDLRPDSMKPTANDSRAMNATHIDPTAMPLVTLSILSQELGIDVRAVYDCIKDLGIEKFHTTVYVNSDRGQRQNIVDAIKEMDANKIREFMKS